MSEDFVLSEDLVASDDAFGMLLSVLALSFCSPLGAVAWANAEPASMVPAAISAIAVVHVFIERLLQGLRGMNVASTDGPQRRNSRAAVFSPPDADPASVCADPPR